MQTVDIAVINAKLDTITDSQEKIFSKVDRLYDAIFDPNTGAFAKSTQVHEQVDNVSSNLTNHISSDTVANTRRDTDICELQEQVKPIPELVRWKSRVNAVSVWLAATAGTGAVGLIVKIFYDSWALRHNLPTITK